MIKAFEHFHQLMTILGYATFIGGIAWGIVTHRRRAKARQAKREVHSVKEMDFNATIGYEAGRPFVPD